MRMRNNQNPPFPWWAWIPQTVTSIIALIVTVLCMLK